MIRAGTARIGIGSMIYMDLTGFRHVGIPSVQLIPVAAPNHPLASANLAARPRPRDFLQLVLSEQPVGEGRDFGVVSLNTWRVGDLNAKHRLIVGGIGWGSMPEPVVRADIEAGRLVRLSLRDWLAGEYPMKVVHKADTPPGPAGRWLIERLMTLSDGNKSPLGREATKPAKARGHRGSGKVHSRIK